MAPSEVARKKRCRPPTGVWLAAGVQRGAGSPLVVSMGEYHGGHPIHAGLASRERLGSKGQARPFGSAAACISMQGRWGPGESGSLPGHGGCREEQERSA